MKSKAFYSQFTDLFIPATIIYQAFYINYKQANQSIQKF